MINAPENKASRKKTGKSELRQAEKTIAARVTLPEYSQIQARAAAAGYSLSAYTRSCLLGDPGPRARRRPVVNATLLAQTHAELRRIGNNINQIARSLNLKEPFSLPEIQKAHEELSLVLFEIMQAFGRKPEA